VLTADAARITASARQFERLTEFLRVTRQRAGSPETGIERGGLTEPLRSALT
jgi:hypothetical protein